MNNDAPTQITLHRKSQQLELVFGKRSYRLSAEYLRVYSPSAETKGHGPGEEVLQLNKQNVAIRAIEAQGNYAIKLIFSDGHDSGIYSWAYLKSLSVEQNENWENYLARAKNHQETQAEKKASPVKWVSPK